MKNEETPFIARMRGLPWTTKQHDVMDFLRDCEIVGGEDGIHFTYSREGRASGECFVELASEDDVSNALAQNNEHIGNRYIEVFKVERSEMEWMIKRAGAGVSQNQGMSDAVLKLRGLPFGCSKEEIAQFFTGHEIVPNGIMLPEDHQGRCTGEAFVQFASPEIANKAMDSKHKDRIGHRYIEIFKSSMNEASRFGQMRGGGGGGGGGGGIRPLMGMPRPGPYDRGDRFGMGMMAGMGGYGRGRGGRNVKGYFEEDFEDYGYRGNAGGFGARNRRGSGGGMGSMRGGRGGMNMGGGGGGGGGMDRRGQQPGSCYRSKTGHSVHMRGLPFQALEQDVFDFFSPIQPVRCEFEFGENGRPTGEANVDFATHQEAVEAMKKHKSNMQHRYIELFLNSEPATPNQRSSGGGGGYGNGNMSGGGGFGSGNMGSDNGYNDDMVPGFGNGGGNGYGGGYGSGSNQSFGGNQGGLGFGSGGGGSGFGNQGKMLRGMNSYMGGGGYGDGGMGGGGGMMGNNYTEF